MIPFWKKTGKHSKPQSAQKRRQNAKPAVPRTAQQSIPMQRMFEDGTCRVKPNYYTRTIQYQDINYQLAQQEDKTAIFEEWCSFLNFFDSSIKFELSFVNMATDSTEFEKSIRIPYQRDGFDDVRAEYRSSGGTGTAQHLRCQIRQVEYRRFAHSAAKVAVSGFCVHQKAVWHPAKADAPPGCGQRDLRYGRRARGRTDLPLGVPASRVQKALFSSVAVQHGGSSYPGGLCPPQTVN